MSSSGKLFGGNWGDQPLYETNNGDITTDSITYDFTAPWSLANSQFQYFSNPSNGFISGEVIEIHPGSKQDISSAIKQNVQKGDLLYWDFEGDKKINHATILTAVTNDAIFYGGHTGPAERNNLVGILANYPNGMVYVVKMR